jgi:tripartite-type tricarboxylate transporter receptor subunit TctC
MIVPYGAGGSLDTLARVVSERMRLSLGQPVVIENITGASGSIAVGRAARAEPDGYTVCIGNWATHVVNGATFTLQYDLLQDLAPVAFLSSNPYVAVARNGLPAKNLQELIAILKAKPGAVTLGTGGPGSGQHISGVYFQSATGTALRFVPYRAGSADILKDVVGGHIDLAFDQAISALSHVRNGRMKAYAVTAATRLEAAPDIPTVDEAGAPGVYVSAWSGLWVPKATPKDVVETLTKAAMAALANADVRRRLEELGQAIPPPAQQTAEALGAFHKAEIEKWWPIIKAANASAEPAR